MTTKRIFITVPLEILDQVHEICKKDVINISAIYVMAIKKHLKEYTEMFGEENKLIKAGKPIKPARTIVQCVVIDCKRRYVLEDHASCPDCKKEEYILSPN